MSVRACQHQHHCLCDERDLLSSPPSLLPTAGVMQQRSYTQDAYTKQCTYTHTKVTAHHCSVW